MPIPVNLMNFIHVKGFSIYISSAPCNLISCYHWLSLIRNAYEKVDSNVNSQEIIQEADWFLCK